MGYVPPLSIRGFMRVPRGQYRQHSLKEVEVLHTPAEATYASRGVGTSDARGRGYRPSSSEKSRILGERPAIR